MSIDIVENLQQAARFIEIDGHEAIHATTALAGEAVAMALLIAHLRRSAGSMNTYPPDPKIDRKVVESLREYGLIS